MIGTIALFWAPCIVCGEYGTLLLIIACIIIGYATWLRSCFINTLMAEVFTSHGQPANRVRPVWQVHLCPTLSRSSR